MDEHLYIITYDIRDSKRWSRIFRLMKGYGVWLQLSVFQCRLSRRRRGELLDRVREEMDIQEDHVLCIDVGPLQNPGKRIISLGRPFEVVEHRVIIV